MKRALLFVIATGTAVAQAPPAGNPVPNMQAIAQGLGVNCQYCHVAARGSGVAVKVSVTTRSFDQIQNTIRDSVMSAVKPLIDVDRR